MTPSAALAPVPTEPISPELVLVDPELRLAVLPTLPPPASIQPRAVLTLAPTPPPAEVPHRRRVSPLLVAAVGGVAVAVVVAVNRLSLPAAPPHHIQAVAQRPARSATAPKPPSKLAPKRIRPAAAPIAGGGYASERIHFRVAANGAAITDLTLRVPCLGTVVIGRLPLGPRAAFSAHRVVQKGAASSRMSVSGLFLSPTTYRVLVRERGACASGTQSMVARLS